MLCRVVIFGQTIFRNHSQSEQAKQRSLCRNAEAGVGGIAASSEDDTGGARGKKRAKPRLEIWREILGEGLERCEFLAKIDLGTVEQDGEDGLRARVMARTHTHAH
eukprot:5233808-Pleurochrysis_carterae.AAC.1